MVADVQPIHQPPQTGRTVRNLSLFPETARTARMTIQTTAQPTL